jgi:aminomethyltransferase
MARRQTPYYHKLVALGAEMADRIGFDAAVRFSTIAEEHLATRERVGVYDVYYQGAVDLKGSDASTFLNRHVVNNVASLSDGQVLYTSVTNDAGGMIDDLTLVRLAPDHFWLFPTPSRVDVVTAWLTGRAEGNHAYVTNMVSGTAYLSIQGPRSRETLAKLTEIDLGTGSLPYELFYPRDYAEHIWDAVMAAGEEFGIVPCGLGALRSVRMEKKYPLYGLDLNETTSPLEASLGWTVDFDKGDFVGRDALLRQRDEGLTRRLVGIEFEGTDFLPQAGDVIAVDDGSVGSVTSSDIGHALRRSLAMGYVEPAAAIDGTSVTVSSAESGIVGSGIVRTKAFYDPDRLRVRA